MLYYAIKVLVSAALIVAISELSKRSTLLGGVLASVPLVSVLALIWLYVETRDTPCIAALSVSIFWLVLPSLSLFLLLPWLLKLKLGFPPALLIGLAAMVGLYYATVALLARAGVRL